MATVIGDRYDHIRINNGTNTTIHYFPVVNGENDGAIKTVDTSYYDPYSQNNIESSPKAMGVGAVSLGTNTVAIGTAAHAEGFQRNAVGLGAHAEGANQNNYFEDDFLSSLDTITLSYNEDEGYTFPSTDIGNIPDIGCMVFNDTHPIEMGLYISHLYLNELTLYLVAADGVSFTESFYNQTFYVLPMSAVGQGAHAEGGALASGDYAHAEGVAHASGFAAHAEGNSSAKASYAHAEGEMTFAKGTDAHAEGIGTYAYGSHTHAEGNYTLAYGLSSHSEGDGDVQINRRLTGEAGALIYTTTNVTSTLLGCWCHTADSTNVTYVTAIDPLNSTITLSTTFNAQSACNNTSVYFSRNFAANGAHVEGRQTAALGTYSHAEGRSNIALGEASHAEGNQTWAFGNYSYASGINAYAIGIGSHAEGSYNVAYGAYSHSEGGYTAVNSIILTGSGTSYTVSTSTTNISNYLYAIIVYGTSVASITAVNNKTITTSATLGTLNSTSCQLYFSSATGQFSHREGGQTCAGGEYSHAEGYFTYAYGSQSHTEGSYTKASGVRAHAEGYYTTASGNNAHAEGYYTIASGQYQHAFGKCNVEDLNNTYAEIVGIGTSTSARKNGRTLDWSGNEQLAGSLTLGLGTTDQTTVTAAQLKQLLNSLPVLVTISNNKITSHTWQQLHDAYFASRLVLQLDEYSAVCGLVSECDGSSDYYYVTFISLFDSSDSKTYDTTSANGYPQYAEPA